MTAALKSRLENLIAMAQLLDRVDANPSLVGAAQYQHLAGVVRSLLDDPEVPADALHAVLRACPAARVLYENLHYDRSGLSQSPLDSAVASELTATELIQRARASAPGGVGNSAGR